MRHSGRDTARVLRRALQLTVVAVTLAGLGCQIKLVADYDEITDRSVTALQREFELFFIDVERNLYTPDAVYDNYIGFYDEVRAELSVIRVRAAARPKNEITVEQLDLVAQNVDNLEELHKLGFESPEELEPLRAAFQQSFQAILTLELAKKRGQ
ncbi:MAG: hypothetical protein JSW46_04940 [Gemmatimonadota bacterium]|nr:MAG: hypothetical protein JSW46_04940 [Gemmatimonadota bacterium]